MRSTTKETVKSVHHWNDTLFSFKTTRSEHLRFESGQFLMIGLEVDGRPLMRAYSVASASWEPELEFFSIKVPDGALTSRLQHIKPGDEVTVSSKPAGTLVEGHLTPGKNLFLLSSGTGLAPFLSIIKDPLIYDNYDKIVLVHSVRQVSDLAYREEIENLKNNEYFGDEVAQKLEYFPTVTRERLNGYGDFHNARITDIIQLGGLGDLTPEHDRFMICGNNDMIKDISLMLDDLGFQKATSRTQGHYVIEQAFIEK